MVRVGLGLYKYSVAYRWKHSVTNGVSQKGLGSRTNFVQDTASYKQYYFLVDKYPMHQ